MSGVRHIAIVDDHHLVRHGIEQLVDTRSDLSVAWSGADLAELIDQIKNGLTVDVALVDIDLGDHHVDEAQVCELAAAHVNVVVVSALADRPSVRTLVRAGAVGLVAKSDQPTDLLDAIDAALSGQSWMTVDMAIALADAPDEERPTLSTREEEVLTLYASGLKIATVARRLNLSPHTVKDYLKRIRNKFASAGVPSTTQLDLHRQATRMGIID